ncbi:hypothetical protein EBH_0034550 [Eimeria brunetti]|uniref:Uncharacterized protein n=1 Tax=Eimeria brunetti TaxID=51314 RepID=U6LMQ9_9EIME|nr:hypothetical protein EBH_0034550 [Eimeria brunetti]
MVMRMTTRDQKKRALQENEKKMLKIHHNHHPPKLEILRENLAGYAKRMKKMTNEQERHDRMKKKKDCLRQYTQQKKKKRNHHHHRQDLSIHRGLHSAHEKIGGIMEISEPTGRLQGHQQARQAAVRLHWRRRLPSVIAKGRDQRINASRLKSTAEELQQGL